MASESTWAGRWWHRLFPFDVALPAQRPLDFQTNVSRRHLFLRMLNRTWLVMALIALVTLPLRPNDDPIISLIMMGLGIGLFFMIRALLIHDQVRLAAALFTVLVDTVFLAIFVSLAHDQGWQEALVTETPTLMMMGLAVLAGGGLLGGWVGFVVAGVNSVLLIVVVIAADAPDPRISIHLFWWILAVIAWLYEMTLLTTFAHLREARETLESTVAERTDQLQQALNQIEAILNHTSDVIVLADARGDILKSNLAFDQLFGTQIDHAIENLVYVIAGDDDITSYSHALLTVMHDAKPQRIEAKVSVINGKLLDADLALAPVQFPDSSGAGVLLNLRDITYLKEIDRFKTRFVANAAHDLSNPLAALKARLYMLKRKPDQLDKHLVILEQQTARMERLIDDLRMLSALDRGAITVVAQTFDFNTLVACSVEAHQAIAAEKNQQLTFAPAQTLPQVYADPGHCERVIVNLIMNALNYTPSEGKISVCTAQCGERVVLTVQDTGMGIPVEDFPHIFERFYRSERAKLVDINGTGLGLAIVKEMVEAHGGIIDVASQIDVGTTFTVSMPLKYVEIARKPDRK